MNRFVSSTFSAIVFASLLAVSALAQNPRIVHTVKKEHTSGPQFAKELWFAPMQNFQSQNDKYVALYVTAKRATTVYVQQGKDISTRVSQPVTPYGVTTFILPLGWEMTSTDVIQQKAIHVWSDKVDILGYMMSHSPATSDGMYIIPAIGWGTDYYVAGYAALDVGGGGQGDEPSEFVIVANQDNTNVLITPACDLRGSGNADIAAHPKGIPFSVSLNKGDAVQFKSTRGGSSIEEDVSGTYIHSNFGIGLMAGSQCPFIPVTDAACDHVVDMIPPIRAWSKTYYTAPFAKRPKGDSFLILGTRPGQQIYRTNGTGPKNAYVIVEPGIPYYDPDVTAAYRWESDTSFLLVQYLNSAYHDFQGSTFGDPAEVVINPVEQFAKTVVFQTPKKQGGQQPYENYANIVVPKSAVASTTIDGVKILGKYNPITIDGVYEVYRIDKINGVKLDPGTHIVKSDSAIGVYVYGYGWFESYAWAGMLGTGIPNPKDTVSPAVVTAGNCMDARISLSDTELLATKLNIMSVDSEYNMDWVPSPKWTEGIGMDSTYYDIQVIDPTLEAYIQVSTYDVAGNMTTVTSTYAPQIAVLRPALNFGEGQVGGTPVILYDTIVNTGMKPFRPISIHWLHMTATDSLKDTYGFSIDSVDLSEIPVGGKRAIKVSFVPTSKFGVIDTIISGDSCSSFSNLAIGTGGAPDFTVTDAYWYDVPLIGPPQERVVVVKNTAKAQDVHISSISWDKTEFTLSDPTVANGFDVHPNVPVNVVFKFTPTAVPQIISQVTWTSKDVTTPDGTHLLPRFSSLIGNAIALRDTEVTVTCAQPGDILHFSIPITNALRGIKTHIDSVTHTNSAFVNLQGHRPNGTTWNPATTQEIMQESSTDTIVIDFPVPLKTNGTWVDNITPYNDSGIIGGRSVKITVNTIYKAVGIPKRVVNFPLSQFGDPASGIPEEIAIGDSTSSDITINSVNFETGNKYNGAFHLGYKLNNTPVTGLPQTLHAGDTLRVLIYFDSTGEFAINNFSTSLSFGTDGCNLSSDVPLNVVQAFKLGSVEPRLFAPIFACGATLDSVPYTSSNASGLMDTIRIKLSGPDAANYVLQKDSITVMGGESVWIYFNLVPSSNRGSSTYTVNIDLRVHTPTSPEFSLSTSVSNTVLVYDVTARSVFSQLSAEAGKDVMLPIDLSVNKRGLPDNLSKLNINAVRLTYILGDKDLLDFAKRDITQALLNPPSGWKLETDPAKTFYKDSLVVFYLTGNRPLDDNDKSLGQFRFLTTLTAQNEATKVTLLKMELFSDDQPVGPCATPLVQDSTFNLLLRCGDSTMRLVMQGKGGLVNFIKPATPDPATGSSVSIGYANRAETDLTLVIYDALGREVARPVNGIHHEVGAWEVRCDVSRLPSGTYTYRLSADRPLNGHPVVISKQFVIQR
jgi:hypothetical protein